MTDTETRDPPETARERTHPAVHARRGAIGMATLAVIGIGLVHWLGMRTAVTVIVAAVIILAALFVLVRLPHVRKHFNDNRRTPRTRARRSSRQARKTSTATRSGGARRSPGKLFGGRGSGGGSGRRGILGRGRGSGSGRSGTSGRGGRGGLLSRLRGKGKPGPGSGAPAGAGKPRRGRGLLARHGRKPGAPGAGSRHGGASGARRRGLFRRHRPGAGTPGGARRTGGRRAAGAKRRSSGKASAGSGARLPSRWHPLRRRRAGKAAAAAAATKKATAAKTRARKAAAGKTGKKSGAAAKARKARVRRKARKAAAKKKAAKSGSGSAPFKAGSKLTRAGRRSVRRKLRKDRRVRRGTARARRRIRRAAIRRRRLRRLIRRNPVLRGAPLAPPPKRGKRWRLYPFVLSWSWRGPRLRRAAHGAAPGTSPRDGLPRPVEATGPLPGEEHGPAHETAEAIINGGRPMHPVIEAANEGVDQIASFRPENVADVRAFLDSIPEYIGNIGQALANICEGWNSDEPMEKAFNDLFHELGAQVAGLADQATELRSGFEREHAEELRRIDDPRTHEELFDVAHNR